MGNEWITINKDVFDIGRYESLNVFRVFLYFLTHAAQKPRFDRGVRLECGQVIVTMDEVCEATGLTAREYRTAISKLIKDKQTTNERQTIDKQPTSQPNPPKNPPFIQKEKENEKENLSPTPPIKEKDKEKEKASPQPSLRKKEKDKLLVCGKTKESGISFSSVAGATSDEQKDLRKEIERKKKLMEGRRVKFYNSLVPFVQMYGKAMVRDFFDYWSEPNKSETQMRYELERTWSLNLRLAYWSRNKKNYVRKSATDEKREANAAVIERLREDALRRLRPMDEEEPLPI